MLQRSLLHYHATVTQSPKNLYQNSLKTLGALLLKVELYIYNHYSEQASSMDLKLCLTLKKKNSESQKPQKNMYFKNISYKEKLQSSSTIPRIWHDSCQIPNTSTNDNFLTIHLTTAQQFPALWGFYGTKDKSKKGRLGQQCFAAPYKIQY